jgi:hypothetical protein
MIIWGGYSAGTSSLLNDGALYDPASGAWTYLSGALPNAPSARYHDTAVWTGTEMIVWGGLSGADPLNDGGRYNPLSNSWAYLPSAVANTPSPRSGHSAVWTGAEMIVWGGNGANGYFNDGGRFNPALNTWTYLPNVLSNSLAGRQYHSAVWSGSQMIVWGGVGNLGYFNDGALYNPSLNSWTYLPNTQPNTPAARDGHTAVWTGAEMLVWGGIGGTGDFNDGGRFNPATATWIYLPNTLPGTPSPRANHTAVWTGSQMAVWGGASNSLCYADGGLFDPSSSSWTYIPNTLAATPAARYAHTAVWTGTEVIVWGGANSGGANPLNDGGRYNPASNTWTYLPNTLANTPAARVAHTAVWTGSQMVVWGGVANAAAYADGGRYDPALNVWTYISSTLPNAPAARSSHTAVWTGNTMLVWAGIGSGYLNDTFGYTPGLALFLYQRP